MGLTIKKGDMVLVLVVMMLAAVSFLMMAGRKTGDKVFITANGRVTEYPLHQNRTISLEGQGNGYNIVVVEDGSVYMKQASCPDQICVHHKKINKDGETIICLPNAVYISVDSSAKKEVDN